MTESYGPFCCEGGIRGYGNTESGIVFIGHMPAFNEMQTGKPFQGADGDLLNSTLKACGWARELSYCTNIQCSPYSQPSVCRSRLMDELNLLKPLIIITLGAAACEHVFGLKISKIRGFILRDVLNMPGVYGMATWMPSAILQAEKPEQQNDFAAEFVRDLKKIKLFYRDNPKRLIVPPKVTREPDIIYDISHAQTILDNLPRDEIVTLDIETPIKDKEDKESDAFDRIRCLGVGLKDDVQYVFPERTIPELLFPSDIQWGGWNIYGFDSVALRSKYGINIPIVHDGMLSSYVRDERTKYGTHKLKHNAREHAGADFWEDDDIRGSDESLYKYNGLDVAYNHRLLRYHTRSFDADDKKLYYDLLIPAANLLSEAQYYGVTIDVHKLLELSLRLGQELVDTDRDLVNMARDLGYPGRINVESSQQVGHFLFDILGVDAYEYSHRTKSGKAWSVDKNVLDSIDHPWCALLRKNRQIADTLARYVIGVSSQVKHDGKVHPKCWLPGTVTGRLSYSDPPVQQLPHARTIGELSQVRSIFTVDSPDYILLEADYRQIELWIMQAFSGDKNLLADLTEPWSVTGEPDYHSRTCLHGVPCLEHINTEDGKDPNCPVCIRWAFDRDGQKHVNFGIPYGETAYGLTRPPPIGTGFSLQKNQALIDTWYKRNTDVLIWQKEIELELKTRGIIKTPFGRKRRMPIILNNKQVRQSINFPIQSVASDYMLSAAIKLRELLKQYDTRLLWLTHDSGLWHVLVKHLEQVKSLVKEVMETPQLPGFPSVKVDMHWGQNLHAVSS